MATSDADNTAVVHRLDSVGDEPLLSDASDGGVVLRHHDRGETRPPAFEGSAPPQAPVTGMDPNEAYLLRASGPDEPTCCRYPRQ